MKLRETPPQNLPKEKEKTKADQEKGGKTPPNQT
jgi:hypothetical protein